MKPVLWLLVAFFNLTFFAACGHKTIKYNDIAVTGDSGLKLAVDWLKNKKKQIDLKVSFENQTLDLMSISEPALTMTFDGQAGILKSFEKDIVLPPGQKESRLLMYTFAPKINGAGTVTFTVSPIVIEDKNGKTRNKQLVIHLPVPN